jgi:ATPase subunit of ABC transporter with duplicated ATPase domains
MLAAVRAARADVLLLDEPANHLDDDGLARLAELLTARQGGLVLVAHDRALLAQITNRVVELQAHDGSATAFDGGWQAYEDERAHAHRHAVQAHERATAERDRITARARAARQRAAQGHRNAQSENDTNLRRLFEQSSAGSERLAGQLARKAARVDVPDRPWQAKPTHLTYAVQTNKAGTIAALIRATLTRGTFTLGPVDLEVRDGDRILLAGPNGCGKSTVLAALAGRLQADQGEIRRAGGAAIAEVAQQRSLLVDDAGADVVAAARARARLDEREARAALAAMGIDQHTATRAPRTLSPGERTRAELAVATAGGARLLLLDEPTNHLDVEALEALEQALERWPGALVVATHDRRLRENLRLDTTVDFNELATTVQGPA